MILYEQIEKLMSKSFLLFYYILCKPADKLVIDIASTNMVFYTCLADNHQNLDSITLYDHLDISAKVKDRSCEFEIIVVHEEEDGLVFNIKKSSILHLEYDRINFDKYNKPTQLELKIY